MDKREKIEHWETKDGEILEISKMTTEHIKNCIKFIQTKLDFHSITRDYTCEKHFLFYKDRYEDLPESLQGGDYLWTLEYGYAYLDRFTSELKNRAVV